MHAEYLQLSRDLLRWSRDQPAEIAIKAELLAFGLELLVDQPDCGPLRQVIKLNAADLVAVLAHRRASRPLDSGLLDGLWPLAG
jgi:hypothetical protein